MSSDLVSLAYVDSLNNLRWFLTWSAKGKRCASAELRISLRGSVPGAKVAAADNGQSAKGGGQGEKKASLLATKKYYLSFNPRAKSGIQEGTYVKSDFMPKMISGI